MPKEITCRTPIAIAKTIRATYGLQIPVDVVQLCSMLSIEIRPTSFETIEKEVNYAIRSIIQKPKDGKCIIYINENDTKEQVRCAIAHELGHYFLKTKTKVLASFVADNSPSEIEAAQFATELLMPETVVRDAHAQLVIPLSCSLAHLFGVPVQAMQKRLQHLELAYV